MMESEEAGATAGQENLEDPEMKKKKLEAVLGKVNDALGHFCPSTLCPNQCCQKISAATREIFWGKPRIEPVAAGRESSMPLCAMLNAKIGQLPSNHLTQPNCFQFNGPCDAVIETSELPCPAPEGVWRLLKPGSKLGDAVFVAIPRVSHLVKKRTLFARQKEISKF